MKINDISTQIQHKDGSTITYPNSSVSAEYEKLNPNPYKRPKQGLSEGQGWIGNPKKWKEAVYQAHGSDVTFKNYNHPGQPGKRSVNAINADGKQVGVYQRHNKMGMVQPNMQGMAEGLDNQPAPKDLGKFLYYVLTKGLEDINIPYQPGSVEYKEFVNAYKHAYVDQDRRSFRLSMNPGSFARYLNIPNYEMYIQNAEKQGLSEGTGESYIIVRTNSEGKKDVFAGNFDSYEKAQKELDSCLAHPLHTKHKQKFEIKKKSQGLSEESNPEYDDEAGMADNNLETLKRAVEGIDDLINNGDNLPEWCQEKIAVAKSTLVSVWDYMKSEETSEQEVNESNYSSDPWGPQGNFAGDTSVQLGGDTVKPLGVGSIVSYFGEKFKIAELNSKTNYARITNNGKTLNAKLSDLKRTGGSVTEGSQQDDHKMALEKLQKALKNPNVPAVKKAEIAKQIQYHRSQLQKGVAEGSNDWSGPLYDPALQGNGKKQRYEMMFKNGQVKRFSALNDNEARKIAAGHSAKSVIRMKGNVPSDKIKEQGVAEAAGSSSFRKGQKVLIVKQGVIATVTKVDKKWGFITVQTNDGRMAQIDERQFNQIKAYNGPMLSPSVTTEMTELLKNGTSPEEVADIMRLPVEVVAEFMPKQQGLSEDWQKVNKKDKTDGMSPKAVKAYRKENPGSKLKTAVTKKPSELKAGSKDANRRKSFCARMGGAKKNASAETRNNPDSPVNKALRRWNCESVEQLEQLVMIAEQHIRKNKKSK